MNRIEILSELKFPTYTELSFIMRFPLPVVWGGGVTPSVPIASLQKIIDSYKQGYTLDNDVTEGTILQWTGQYNVQNGYTLANYKIQLAMIWNNRKAIIDAYTLSTADQISQLAWTGSSWITV